MSQVYRHKWMVCSACRIPPR